MKPLQKLIAVCFLIMSAYTTQAQIQKSNRRPQFKNVANRVPATISELDKAFAAKKGETLTLNFKGFTFKGIVTSSIKRYDNLYSVIIKSLSLNNTLFSISKRINKDKSIAYVGRIINENYADGYQLVKEADGNYALTKIQTEELIQDY